MKRFIVMLGLLVGVTMAIPHFAGAAEQIGLTGVQCPQANTDYLIDLSYVSNSNDGTFTLMTNYETRQVLKFDDPLITVTMRARSDQNGYVRMFYNQDPVSGSMPIGSNPILVCR